jgi:inorganic pyrophosphatase
MITVLHPWHGAHYGEKSPKLVNAIIEIPQGSRAKYEVDKNYWLAEARPGNLFIFPLSN